MPRPRVSEPRDQQVLVRLTARQLDVLESVAHLDRTKPNTYAHQILVEHLAAVEKNPRVQADLANRAAYESDAVSSTPLRGRVRSNEQAAVVTSEQPRGTEISPRHP